MKVWLITTGEPLPVDPGLPRLLRTGALAYHLARKGHDVSWWCSTFNHAWKTHRAGEDTRRDLMPGLRLVMLHGRAYARNVSIRRVRNHRDVAARFEALAPAEPVPDVVLCSLPTLELCQAAVAYGLPRKIPVVLDIRDLWPDTFLDLLPAWAAPLGRLALRSAYARARAACRDATAIVGVTPDFVRWGLEKAGRAAGPRDQDFPLAYSDALPDPAEHRKAEDYWDQLGLTSGGPEFRICFFGSLSHQFDVDTVIEAARLLRNAPRPVKFVLCGTGDRLEHYRRRSSDLNDRIVLPGWVGGPQIWTLMRRCSAGLAPYLESRNFRGHLPNKIAEYLSAGLPILSTLRGFGGDLLASRRCGVSYRAGDPASLQAAILGLLERPDETAAMTRRAKLLFQERFDAALVFSRFEAYLESLAPARTSR